MTSRNCLDTALELLVCYELWPVIIKPGQKAPIGESWGALRPTEQSIREMFDRFPGAGVGLLLGPDGGIIDIECDGPGGEESLAKLMGGEIVRTLGWSSRRGPHHVFRYDARLAKHGKSIIKLPELPGLEIRIGATGKQLQSNCPPTLGDDGKPREWNGCDVISDVSDAAITFLDAALTKPEPKTAPTRSTRSGDVEDRARKYVQKIDPAISGEHGHDKAFYAACKVGPGFDLPRDLALRILREEFNPRCRPKWSEQELEHKIDDAYAEEPRRGWLLNGRGRNNGRRAGLYPALADQPITNKEGGWKSCQTNSGLWLKQQTPLLDIRHDSFQRTIFIGGAPITDATVIRLTGEIERFANQPWAEKHMRAALIDFGYRNECNSLTDWLDSLAWDGVLRVNEFFHHAYGCDSNSYTWETSRILFLSAVARAYRPGCQADIMPVMMSDQGEFKSTGIAALCPRPEWFAEDLGSDLADHKGAGEGLQGKWLVEFSEFSRINRVTLDMIKAFITRRVDRYRSAYGHIAEDFPRMCIFIGTTNDTHPLHDIQNRRFMPIRCRVGNVDWIRSNRDQLWAEAVGRFKANEPWWTTDAELAKQAIQEQEAARLPDLWESILEDELKHRNEVTMHEAVVMLKLTIDRVDRGIQTRIGNALRKLGFAPKRKATGERERFYIRLAVQPQGLDEVGRRLDDPVF